MILARRAAVAAAIGFGALAGFQLALALGAPWGKAAFGGYVGRPGAALRAVSATAAAVWTAAALVTLRRAGFPVWAPLPRRMLPVAVWVLAGVTAVSAVPNALSESALERAIWLPFCIVLTGAVATVAVRSHGVTLAELGETASGTRTATWHP